MKVLVIMAGTWLVLAPPSPKPGDLAGRDTARSLLADTTICPPDGPDTRRAVVKFLASSAFAEDRTELGLTIADTANVRVLADSTDATTCQWFRQEVTLPADRPRDWAYYEAGGFYFVPMVPRCDLCLRHGALAIFDSTRTIRKTLGI